MQGGVEAKLTLVAADWLLALLLVLLLFVLARFTGLRPYECFGDFDRGGQREDGHVRRPGRARHPRADTQAEAAA